MNETIAIPRLAETDDEIERCFDVMSELRPHLVGEDFVATVRKLQDGGYELAYIEDDGSVVAVAGFRVADNLFMGRHLYVDDLVTAEDARSRGFGEAMMDWLRERAVESGCAYFHLDSGTHRGRAHRFYFAQGMTIASYHFSEQLSD